MRSPLSTCWTSPRHGLRGSILSRTTNDAHLVLSSAGHRSYPARLTSGCRLSLSESSEIPVKWQVRLRGRCGLFYQRGCFRLWGYSELLAQKLLTEPVDADGSSPVAAEKVTTDHGPVGSLAQPIQREHPL